MMTGRFLPFAAGVVFCTVPSAVVAQRITVQQPAIRNIGVGTIVSVPDSGGAFLGRVARAGESRSRFGPFPSGTSTGLFREHAGMSAHVRIHDLREMDERLLRQRVNSASVPTGRRLTGNAEHAYRLLLDRHASRGGASVAGRAGRQSRALRHETSVIRTAASVSEDATAARFYELGLRAEQRGQHSLAWEYFRIAARHGSEAAGRKLAAPRLATRSR